MSALGREGDWRPGKGGISWNFLEGKLPGSGSDFSGRGRSALILDSAVFLPGRRLLDSVKEQFYLLKDSDVNNSAPCPV